MGVICRKTEAKFTVSHKKTERANVYQIFVLILQKLRGVKNLVAEKYTENSNEVVLAFWNIL